MRVAADFGGLGGTVSGEVQDARDDGPHQTAQEVEDDELMARFCEGDERAFDSLYRKYASHLHAFVKRMVNQRSLADDLLQTTFLTVVRARGRYRRGTSVRAWMFAIAANAARDSLRRSRVRGVEATPSAANEPSVAPPSLPDPPVARALQSALDSLSAEQREAVLLHKMHGLSFAEIAETLGITAGAAKVRAHRGYEQLRSRLAAFGDVT
jgi:RNA polymerase sigma factor (sigma-70 family)